MKNINLLYLNFVTNSALARLNAWYCVWFSSRKLKYKVIGLIRHDRCLLQE